MGLLNESPDERADRLAKNELFFRDSNELMLREGGLWRAPDFICECSRRGCVERVALSRAEYERVRAESTHFFVVPSHEDLTVEIVIEAEPGYLIVAKVGEAAAEVERAS